MGKYDLKGLRDTQEPEAEQAAPAVAPAMPKPASSRPLGKRSTPGFSRTTVYMRDDTKLKAVRLLQDRKDNRDLSDLIESLVSGWVTNGQGSKRSDV